MKLARTALIFAAAAALCAPALAGGVKRPVVVELFTSQGCSSCPPADALLAQLAQRHDVLAMSLPITYWDMLGWKDTLASEANTHRQKAYAAAMGHGGIYTPQMIIDGVSDVVGSREGDVETAIAKREAEIELSQARIEMLKAEHQMAIEAHEAQLEQSTYVESEHVQAAAAHAERVAANQLEAVTRSVKSKGPLAVPVAVSETPSAMHIDVGATDAKVEGPATIWLFHLRNAVTVNIGAGENQGHTMTYHNVVGDLRPVGQWKGDAVSLDVPRASLQGLPHDAVAVVVQQGGYGRVVGATLFSHPDYDASH
jgi:hypothetical protein